jgi:hypothetical protein
LSAPDSQRVHALTLLTRAECGLCEEMLNELQALGARHVLPPLRLLDVDSDRELQRRYGMKIPVLLLDDAPVCSVRLDREELLRVLRIRPDSA